MTATATRPQAVVAGPAAAVTPAQAQLHGQVEALARRLRLPYLRAQLPDTLAAARSQRWDPGEVVRVLLDAEAAGRDTATIASRRRQAGFAQGKTFSGWDEHVSSIPAAAQQALRTLEWVARHENLCVAGPSGTGKSHFLEALGHHAIDQGMKVTWTTLEALGGLVRRHRVDDSVAKAITRLLRVDLVVVDDIGLLPVSGDAAEAFYRLIDAAYEKRSLAISSNVHPAGFDELLPATLAAAGVDRLLHHAHVILTQGDSHRLREATTGKGVIPLT